MHLIAKSDQSTGNQTYCSYVIKSNEVALAFTAPYSSRTDQNNTRVPHPGFVAADARRFFNLHGLAVRAIGLLVDDAGEAFRKSVQRGASVVLEPRVLTDDITGEKMVLSEVKLYGDVVLRYMSSDGFQGPFLPNYQHVNSLPLTSGLQTLSHVTANVENLLDSATYIAKFTGFHEVAEFTAGDFGTKGNGLNMAVFANNSESVVFSLTQAVGSLKHRLKFLQHNEGPGIQCLAFTSIDIFWTANDMRTRFESGGFDLLPKPGPSYYSNLSSEVRSILSEKQLKSCEELGIWVEKTDHGVLLQLFTRPVGDRPTLFLEINQVVCPSTKDSANPLTLFGKNNLLMLCKSLGD